MEKKAIAAVIINLGSNTWRTAGSITRCHAGRGGSERAGAATPGCGPLVRARILLQQAGGHFRFLSEVLHPRPALLGFLEHLGTQSAFTVMAGEGRCIGGAQGSVQRIREEVFPFVAP